MKTMLDDLTDEDRELLARMRITAPPKKAGRLERVRFTVPEVSEINDELGVRRAVPGEYSKIQEIIPSDERGGILWMSDTPAEIIDHLAAAHRIADPSCRRVLINGLGLGCITKLAASFDHVEHIDVVDIDPRVIKLGRWLTDEYGDRVHLIEASAYEINWKDPDVHWDVVWHDIWPYIDEDNLDGMHLLHEKYRDHCGWQDSWVIELCMMCQDVNRELLHRVEMLDGQPVKEGHQVWQSKLATLAVQVHYDYFYDLGYRAAARDGHHTPIDKLDKTVRAAGFTFRPDGSLRREVLL